MGWMVLGLIFGALAYLLVIVLMRIAHEEDRTARHTHRRLDPYADVTVTLYRTRV